MFIKIYLLLVFRDRVSVLSLGSPGTYSVEQSSTHKDVKSL